MIQSIWYIVYGIWYVLLEVQHSVPVPGLTSSPLTVSQHLLGRHSGGREMLLKPPSLPNRRYQLEIMISISHTESPHTHFFGYFGP